MNPTTYVTGENSNEIPSSRVGPVLAHTHPPTSYAQAHEEPPKLILTLLILKPPIERVLMLIINGSLKHQLIHNTLKTRGGYLKPPDRALEMSVC